MLPQNLLSALEVSVRRHDDATRRQNRFGKECRNRFRTLDQDTGLQIGQKPVDELTLIFARMRLREVMGRFDMQEVIERQIRAGCV